MFSFLVSMLVFVGAVCCQVIVYRFLVGWGVVTAKTIIVYVIGFLVLVGIVRSMQFPLAALWFYTLLVFSYLLYFLSYLSDGESPSAKALTVVRDHGPIRYPQILNHFTNEELIGMRLTRLIRSGWLEGSKRRVRVTGKGAAIAVFFTWYRRLLRWDEGG